MDVVDLEKASPSPPPAVLPPSSTSNSTSSPPPSYQRKSIDSELGRIERSNAAYKAKIAKENAAFGRSISSWRGWLWMLYSLLLIWNTALLLSLALQKKDSTSETEHDLRNKMIRNAPVTAIISFLWVGIVGIWTAFNDTPVHTMDGFAFTTMGFLWAVSVSAPFW